MKTLLSPLLRICLSLPLGIVLTVAASNTVAGGEATSMSARTKHHQHHAGDPSKTMPFKYLKGTAKTSKTHMGVKLDYAFASASVDQAGLLQLTITRRGGGDQATITLEPDSGLLLFEGLPSSPAPFNPGARYLVKVQPTVAGLRYLNVFLKSGTSSEALAIAVQLGKDANLQKTGVIQTMPNGQRVISVPAQ